MKKTLGLSTVLCALLILAPGITSAATDWILDICPGVLMVHPKGDDFSVQGPGQKETVSQASTYPSAALGMAVEFPEGYFDLKAGVGMIVNSRFNALSLFAQTGLSLEMNPGFLMGPHMGYALYMNPTWWGDGDVSFSDTGGVMGGLHVLLGDKMLYYFSLDYYLMEFDVDKAEGGWTASPNQLDLSGLGVAFGFRTRF